MSKRSRSTGRSTPHRRPGTRPPAARTVRERPAGAGSELEDAALIAEDIVEERPSALAREVESTPRTTGQRHRTAKPGSLLAAKAATEYVYVAQDLRRITLVAVVLFGFLLVAWLLIVVLRIIPLPFY